ncbi:unnamed protein product [Meloidogyne enterolobii]|uniref:Uncharacterized protein n=1 Tax=Meloidogyne enterolobii TaxID=390850 RepID=A0ACB0YG25_MELEN
MVQPGMEGIIINGSTLSYAFNHQPFEIEQTNISAEKKHFFDFLIGRNTEEKLVCRFITNF